MHISATVLMGGKNSRMQGENKALMEFKERQMLEHILDVIKPIFDEIIFVSNDSSLDFKSFTPTKIVADIIPNMGALSGIHAALTACSNPYSFVFACDMPLLDKNLILNQLKNINSSIDAIIPKHPEGIEPLHGIYAKSSETVLKNHILSQENKKISLFLSKIQTFYWEIPYYNAFVNINTENEKIFWEKHLNK
jgi:molybdopterin-guanine dinucleotide biosynthesis protein A